MRESPQNTCLPLRDIRVVELGSFIAGPHCATVLADLGADVVKVERPRQGDLMRQSPPFLEGESSAFVRLNRHKRSIALDIASSRGREVFLRLAARADVVVENLRPGAADSLALAYADLIEVNDQLIYAAISGWGRTGPYASRPGLDIMAQAMSGLMSITGEAEGGPVKVGVPICDLACSLYATIGILAALRERDRTGRGDLIDVSLFESGVSLTVWEASRYFATGEVPVRLGSAHQASAPYQAFATSDGYIAIGAVSPGTWPALCEVIGAPELVSDPRFVNNHTRWSNRRILQELIEAKTKSAPTVVWSKALEQVGVPCAPINTYDRVVNDPQLAARGFLCEAEHTTIGRVTYPGSPLKFSNTAVRQGKAGPLLGEHTADVLAELGFVTGDVVDMAQAGVVQLLAGASRP